jgi:DNA polymerase III epsilon subunit-like protein
MSTCPLIIDFEASALNSEGSYPIEIAWTKTNGDIVSHLIDISSVKDHLHWSQESEEVHGIHLEEVLSDGVCPKAIVEEFLKDREGRPVISDGPLFDYSWMKQLFTMAEQDIPFGQIVDFETLISSTVRKKISGGREVQAKVAELISDGVDSHRTHRAAGDVLALRNTFLRAMFLKPEVALSPSF